MGGYFDEATGANTKQVVCGQMVGLSANALSRSAVCIGGWRLL